MRQVGPGGGSTFGSQATFVLPWNDTMAVAMLDRWRAVGLGRIAALCDRSSALYRIR
jgi:hypothetical protein